MTKVLLPIAVALWVFLLRGFVSTRTLIVLSIAGPLLLVTGTALIRSMGRHLLKPGWYAGGFVVGLVMIGGAAATLSRAIPEKWLGLANTGWWILDERIVHLAAAIDADDAGLVRRLASRGVGEPVPLDGSGRPVIHSASTPDVVRALVESGLDPDARDAEGRTLLMTTRNPEIVRILLAAGTDVSAQDRHGFTVGDSLPEDLRAIVEAHAGRPLPTRTDADSPPRGRTDWLTITRDPAAQLGASAVTVRPRPVSRGDLVAITATLANDSAEDQTIHVTATLNDVSLFVSASHDGVIEDPERLAASHTVAWPILSLPSQSRGQLELRVITSAESDAGQLGVQWNVRHLASRDAETLEVSEPLGVRESDLMATTGWSWVYVAVAALFVAGMLMLLRWHGRLRTPGQSVAASAVAAPLLFGSAAVCAMAAALFLWSMAEPFVQFDPAECTILDRRARLRTYMVSDTSRRGTSTSTSNTRSETVALAAVRIETGPEPVIATGFASDGYRSPAELRPFALGARVPCWTSPTIGTRFTLVRHPSISGIAAVGGLTLTALVLLAIARAIGAKPADSPTGSGRGRRRRRA